MLHSGRKITSLYVLDLYFSPENKVSVELDGVYSLQGKIISCFVRYAG